MFSQLVRHGTLVTVSVLIVCVLGILAASRIPVQMIPDLDVRTITVRTQWPGATPQDIEKEILLEQEQYLRTIPNLARMESSAEFGAARIELEFPFGIDLTATLIEIGNALNQVPAYPANVDEPRIFASSFSANAFMFFRVAPLPGNPQQLDMDMMYDFIDDQVRPRMASVNGVSEVRIGGGAERQVHIYVDPAKLAQYRLDPSAVRDAIRERNRDISGGELESGQRRYLLRTLGRFDSLDELEQLILVRRGDRVVRLADVGHVTLDHARIRELAFVDGAPVINLSVRRNSGSNVIAIKQAMLAEIDAINQQVLHPRGMDIAAIADDVVYVEESVRNVWKNLLLGALLASLILYAFLRSLRLTLLGVLGIPVCTIAAFLGLLLAGRTINVISLAGIAFAIGMTLDNTIVVLESIELERRRGLDRLQAAVNGVRKVWPAVLASTLTTIMVFLPILFIAEEAGQLYSDVAVAIAAAILMSMLVAITVVPTASARLSFVAGDNADSGFWRRQVLAGCDWLLASQRRRLATIAITVLVSAGIVGWLTPPAEYLPEGEEAKTFASLNAPPGYNLSTMAQIADDVQADFLPHVGADRSAWLQGNSPVPPLKYLNTRVSADGMRIITEPVDAADIEAVMAALVARYEQYPDMRSFAARGSIISSNDGGTRSINLDISGADLVTLFAVANATYQRAREVFDRPSIQTRPSSLSLAQPMLQVLPDFERASELGISLDKLGFTVAALSNGAWVSEFFQTDDKIDIYLYNQPERIATVASLPHILLYTDNGVALPLTELARLEETVDTPQIRRVDGRRTVTLSIVPPRSVALETGVATVRDDIIGHLRQTGQLPAGVDVRITGAADQLDATRAALVDNYLVALAIIYLLLVAIFSHWGYPLLIMTTIPLGMAAGIAGLAVMNLGGELARWLGLAGLHQPFDMITMLGFLILMGTVVNNPILIVHRAIDNGRQAMDAQAAVREAVQSRLRPIAISTLTTLAGLAPLVFLPGAGSELYRGLGVVVLGGIVGATVVTLTLLPALTVVVLQWQQRR